MGVGVNYSTINYRNQSEFDYFFATAFDRYDRNRDGRIDYMEFQPLINDMCQMITQRYGYGPTVDKIRAAWSAMDFNRSGYITRHEFSTRAKYEIERILTQPVYCPPGYKAIPPPIVPPPAYGAGYVPPPIVPPPVYGAKPIPPPIVPPPVYGAKPIPPPIVPPPAYGAKPIPPPIVPPPAYGNNYPPQPQYGGYPPKY